MGICLSCCEDDRGELNNYRRREAPYPDPTRSNLQSNDSCNHYFMRTTTTQVIRNVPVVARRTNQAPRSRSCNRSAPKRDTSAPRSQSCTRAVAKRSEPTSEPLYGEFKCHKCGRFWISLRSWRDGYQMCKRCENKVYPTNQRKVLDTDRTRNIEDVKEHPKEYCQKCIELGRYCGS